MKFPWISLWLSLAVSTSILAQSSGTREGLKLGPLIVRPSIDAEAGYDDRASIVAGKGVEEVYSQWGAAVGLSNDAARYGFTADAKYGQRYYRDNSELNDDFYSLGASLSSARNSIQWGLASSLTKSLSYNTLVDSTAAEAPVGILTDETTRNITASAGLSYEHAITERTGISPYVGATHFFQDLGTQTNAEWQTYNAGCEVAFAYSDRTLLSLVADHGVQVNDDEDGSVSSLTVGSRPEATIASILSIILPSVLKSSRIERTSSSLFSDSVCVSAVSVDPDAVSSINLEVPSRSVTVIASPCAAVTGS